MSLLFASALFLCMLLAHESGRRIGLKQQSRHDTPPLGTGTAESAVFTILGLLMAFTFNGAADRLAARRHQITLEANAISTAYQRLDLLPQAAQPELRIYLRRYLATRAGLYSSGSEAGYAKQMRDAGELQAAIWRKASDAALRPDSAPSVATVFLPSLNGMFDLATERHVSRSDHPPEVIFLMLGALSLLGSALVGFGSAQSRRRNWFHTLAFCAVVAATAYVILDLEYPRQGLIQIQEAGNPLAELLEAL